MAKKKKGYITPHEEWCRKLRKDMKNKKKRFHKKYNSTDLTKPTFL